MKYLIISILRRKANKVLGDSKRLYNRDDYIIYNLDIVTLTRLKLLYDIVAL